MSASLIDDPGATRGAVDYQALGRPIRGPRALSEDWARFWHLAFNIAVMQWRTRFFGSVLGYVWQLVRPLLLFGVLYVFFVIIEQIGRGGGAPESYYGSQLLGSIVLMTFFQESTMGAVRCVVDNEPLVRKIQFPRLVIPLSIVLLSLFNLSLNLLVVFAFALIQGVRPMVSWFELPLLIAMLAVLATGLAMLLSALFVYLRDLQPIWEVVMQVLFYASPVIVPFEEVQQKLAGHEWLVHVYMANPLTAILQQFRHAIVTHLATSSENAIGGMAWLAIPALITVGIFALGFWVFNRTAPRVAENL